MKTEIEITDVMIEKSINNIVRGKIDKYFEKEEWKQFDKYNETLYKVIQERVYEVISEEKINTMIASTIKTETKYIARCVAEVIAGKISNSFEE